MFRNMMVMLGLGPDEEYEDRYLDEGYDDEHDEEYADVGAVQSRSFGDEVVARPIGSLGDATQPSAVGAVRPLRSVSDDITIEPEPSVREIGMSEMGAAGMGAAAMGATPIRSVSDGEPTVRPMPIQRTKPRVLTPQSFGDAKVLADEFKRSVPVIMNLQTIDRDLARRLIDFSSGVCYSLSGSMEKMAPQVFLLTPRNVEVSDEDRRRIEERGFDR